MDSTCDTPLADAQRLEAHLHTLVTQSFEALSALPEQSVIEIPTEGGGLKALVWRDLLEDGRIRLVVQSASSGFCCAGSVSAVGVFIAPDGQVVSASDDDLKEFRMD